MTGIDKEKCIKELKKKYIEINEKIELKKKRKKENVYSIKNENMIRSSRITDKQRERMKLMVKAVRDDKKDAMFGANDGDWEVYRAMDRDKSDSDEEEKAYLTELETIEFQLQV